MQEHYESIKVSSDRLSEDFYASVRSLIGSIFRLLAVICEGNTSNKKEAMKHIHYIINWVGFNLGATNFIRDLINDDSHMIELLSLSFPNMIEVLSGRTDLSQIKQVEDNDSVVNYLLRHRMRTPKVGLCELFAIFTHLMVIEGEG
jgi:hypothetical protein